jgi:hypothetical protein
MDFRYMRWLILLSISCITFVSALGQAPNFSGIWKMDPELSDFGPQTVPMSAEYVIRHVGGRVSFNYKQDGSISRVDLIPDNEERITSSTEDTAIWTRTHWSGKVLVIESRERRKFGIQSATGSGWVSRWSLSPDGHQLIIKRTIRNNMYETKQRVVYLKQPLNQQPSENRSTPTASPP